MSHGELKRGLGLGGAVSILIGYTIGASIYVLIGELAVDAGPGLWMVYIIASIPALFTCFTTAQVGSALPVAGANYVMVSRTLGPFWGFMTVWSLLITTLIGVPLVAYGLAEYLSIYLTIPIMETAIIITILFGLINIIGIGVTGWIQNIMVIIFMLALFIFGAAGIFNADPENITPLLPNGVGALVMSAIPAYFSFVGFLVIVELGEEIKNPSRNIPRAILISFLAVLVVYTLVTFSLTAVLNWETLVSEESVTAVITAAHVMLPNWLVLFIYLGALLAAFTTINGILATSPREVYALARDRVLPGWLARTGRRLGTPYMAIALVTILSIIGILLGAGIVEYAVVTVMGVMAISILIALGVLRLRKKLPEHYDRAPYKLRGFWYYFWPIGMIVIAVIYIALGLYLSMVSVGIFFAAVALGALLYIERRWRLKKAGVDIVDIFEKDVDGILKRAVDTDE
ncbi:MAG: amino acid permease [Deltaproteobacteria bacterium]|nr:amino acid permease [Candidatus Zymogenaceae bacterium]